MERKHHDPNDEVIHRKKWADANGFEMPNFLEVDPQSMKKDRADSYKGDSVLQELPPNEYEAENEYNSDSFEEEPEEKAEQLKSEQKSEKSESGSDFDDENKMKKEIMNLGKKQRDLLRESLSTMKFGQQISNELPEEIISDEEKPKEIEYPIDTKPTEIKTAKKQPQEISPEAPASVPRPKIVCPSLYANTVATRSQAALKPYVDINNDVLEAIRAENESVRSGKKPINEMSRAEKEGFNSCRPFSQVAAKKPFFGEEKKAPPSGTKGVDVILERVKKLDQSKIDKLMEILAIIENDEEPNSKKNAKIPNPTPVIVQPAKIESVVKEPEAINKGPNFISLAQPSLQPVIIAPQLQQVTPSIMPIKDEKMAAPVKSAPRKNELIFRILSTWGHPHVAGLCEIELFDNKGKKISAPISAKNLGSGPTQPTTKLTNGKIYINDEKFMWIAYIPPPPKSVELIFSLPTGFNSLGGIAVWNYNKNSLDSVKGVRDAEILYGGSVIWSGTIKRANGRINEDYSTEILLCDSQEVFKEKPKAPAAVEEDLSIQNNNNQEIPMPKELLKIKQEIENNNSRPISVPTWLQGEESKFGHIPVPSLDTPSISKPTDTSTSSSKSNQKDDLTKKTKPLFPEKPSRLQQKQATHTNPAKQLESKSTTNRGRKQAQNIGPLQRDLSMERNIDNLLYFEASKPQRFLTKKTDTKKQQAAQSLFNNNPIDPLKNPQQASDSGKKVEQPIKNTVKTEPELIAPLKKEEKQLEIAPKIEKGPDILDQFVQGFDLGGKKEKPQPVSTGITYESLKELYSASNSFMIPELPKGKIITFDILSTWEDPHYVGLCGIEIFTSEGMPLKIHPTKISADPKDINILPEYGSDPRTVDKLVDGTYFSKDDLHVWLAPYTPGMRHVITIDLGLVTTISMIRIWNYNKSRIHSERGVKDLIVTLDEKNVIFMGEIKKAPGTLTDLQQCCEVMLFTENEDIISQISAHDWIETVEIEEKIDSHIEERPSTATKKFTPDEIMKIQKVLSYKEPTERPLTTAMTGAKLSMKEQLAQKDRELANLQIEEEKKKLEAKNAKHTAAYGSVIMLNIVETWGDLFYVGLTGIELYNERNEKIQIEIANITANPKDLNSIPGYSGDYRTIDKIIDGTNLTTDDRHMWLIPFNKGQPHKITITLPKPTYLSSIKFYNYNKSTEDTNRGVKIVTISVDNKLVTPKRGVVIRKAPGTANFDFGYSVKVPQSTGWETNEISAYNKYQNMPISLFQEYLTPALPTGFTFEIILYSTYGDIHYIGLNGIEMYDLLGRPMLQNQNYHVQYKLDANPSSINQLPGLSNDIRTPDKLTDGYNETSDDRHMWLAPYKNTKLYAVTNREVAKNPNIITICFNAQVALGGIRIWNYAKTPSRGVQEFSIFCDNRIIYRVFLYMKIIYNIGFIKTSYQK